jgi:hypothetical protein
MDMNDLVTALDTIKARPDDPILQAKISSHSGQPDLNDPITHSINNPIPA